VATPGFGRKEDNDVALPASYARKRAAAGAMRAARAPRRRRPLLLACAALFAVAAAAACWWSWEHYRKVYAPPKTPVPVLDFIPTVPKDKQQEVTRAITSAAALVLTLSPGQIRDVAAIWKEPPKSLEELISKQKQMDRLLTPGQLARMRPVRTIVQGRIVDAMFENARSRFTPQDFEQLKGEIKRRVSQRMDTP
jgi:hypothetical protein